MRPGRAWVRIAAALAVAVPSLVACNDFVFRTLMEGAHGAAWAGPLAILPAALTLEQAQTADFAAKGGSGVYRFSIPSPLGGSTLDGSGHYQATSTAVGIETVRVTDSIGNTSDARVTVTSATGPIPDYTIVSPSYPPGPYAAGSGFAGNFRIGEISGNPGAQDITWRAYLSGNTIPDGGDTILADGTIAGGLGASATSAVLPLGGTWPASGGAYYIIIELIASDDTGAGNNRAVSGLITVPAPSPPDYAVTGVTPAAPITVSRGAAISQSLTFANSGAGAGTASIYWEARLSPDAVFNASDTLLASGVDGGLAVGSSLTRPVGGAWPAAGTWFLIARVTAADDTAPGNDTLASAQITVQPPDYVVQSVANVGGTTASGPISGQFTYRNTAPVGNGTLTVFWKAYTSTQSTLNGSAEVLIDSGTAGPLNAATTSSAVPFSGTWPANAAPPCYLIVQVSASDEAVSPNESAAGPFTLSSAPLPDVTYLVQTVSNTGGTVGGNPIQGSFTYRNSGTAAGTQTVYWSAYTSTLSTLNGSNEVLIATGTAPPLPAGQPSASAVPFAGGTWPAGGGTCYLIVQVGASDSATVDEGPSGAIAVSSTPPPDYAVTAVTAPGTPVSIGATIAQSLTFMNSLAAGSGASTVYYEAYLSLDPGIDGADTLLTSGVVAGLPAGGSVTRPIGGTWPAGGPWYIVARVTAADDTVTGNNTLASAQVTVQPPDYVVQSLSNLGGTTSTGPVSGQFTYRNQATVGNGTRTVFWKAYYSTLNTLDGSTEVLIDSGTASQLNAGVTSGAVAFSGAWPLVTSPRTYYLIVQVTALDDATPASLATGGLTVNPRDVRYQVSAATNTSPTTTVGDALTGRFTLDNIGTDNGGQGVFWIAYLSSDAVLNVPGDPVIDSGGQTPMTAAEAARTVSFAGTWPSTAGSYILFVVIGAADDIDSANNIAAAGPIAVGAPDYAVTAVTNTGGTYAGGAMAATFTIDNIRVGAENNGDQTITWAGWRSSDTTFGNADDVVVATGTLAGMAAAAGPVVVPFSGTWPAVSGTYRLFVTASAADDAIVADNTASSADIVVNSTGDPTSPNYAFTSVTFPSYGNPGLAFNNDPAYPLHPAPPALQFQIRNSTANAGRADVNWYLYLSRDAVLDSGDGPPVASGTIPGGLAGSGTSAFIPYAGSWPAGVGNYYTLILRLAADDDGNPADDLFVSPRIPVPTVVATEGVGPVPADVPGAVVSPPLSNYDLATSVAPGQLVEIRGTMDSIPPTTYDTYKFTVAAGITGLELTARWATGADSIDMHLFYTSDISSVDVANDAEPRNPPWSILLNGFVGGETLYSTIVPLRAADGGKPYTLLIYGK